MNAFMVATTETRLDINSNKALCNYLDAYLPVYSQVSRFLWYELQDPAFAIKYKSRSQFISFVCVKFNLLKRTANSLYYDISGRISALRALKKHELSQLKHKIKALEKKQKTLIKKINTIKKGLSLIKSSKKNLFFIASSNVRCFICSENSIKNVSNWCYEQRPSANA